MNKRENIELELKKIINNYPLRYGKIKKYFGIHSCTEKEMLRSILLKLQLDGTIYFDGTNYVPFSNNLLVTKIETIGGTKKNVLQACFVLENGKVIPIKEEDLHGAIEGDTVVLERKKRKVLNILKRKKDIIYVEVYVENGVKLLRPIRVLGDKYLKVRISSRDMKKLVPEDIIAVRLQTEYNDGYYEADMLEKISNRSDPNMALKVIAANHGFFTGESKEIANELKKFKTNVTKDDLSDRLDLREENLFTIDCKNTKDMDDAVGLKILSNGSYELNVSIADVAYYVKRESAIFKKAKESATSLYMVNSVIPMLPKIISNGICSLNELEDRLALSVIMHLNPDGDLVDYRIEKTVICSKKKMSYEEVERVLKHENVIGYESFAKTLYLMNKLALKLKLKRNALPFSSGDITYRMDEIGNIIDFNNNQSTEATNIIEQFMILANSCMAEYCTFLNLPIPYRVHEKPTEYKIDNLFASIKNNGFDINDCLTYNLYETLNNILRKYQNKEEYIFLSNLILRTMRRAAYDTYNIGHYALKETYYAHFTSPIRRLPDLLLHMQIHTILDKTYPQNFINSVEMQALCEHSTFMEREAQEAEKEADLYTILRYMNNHPEKTYKGYIKEIKEDEVIVVTNAGISGKIELDTLPSGLTIDVARQVIKSKHKEYLKTGNVCLLKPNQIDLLTNKVTFTVEKNLSLYNFNTGISLVLEKSS